MLDLLSDAVTAVVLLTPVLGPVAVIALLERRAARRVEVTR